MSVLVALVVILGGCCELFRMAHRARVTRLDILSIMGATFIFFFVGRPIYVLVTRQTSVGASSDARYLNDALLVGLERGLWICALFVIMFIVGSKLVISARSSGGSHISNSRAILPVRASVLLMLACLVGAVVFIGAVQRSGSLAAYFLGLSIRSSTLAGQAYIGYLYLPIAMLTCVLLLKARTPTPAIAEGRLGLILVAIGIGAALGAALVSGGRAAVLLGVALPIALFQDCASSWRRRAIIVAFAASVVVLVGLSVGLRGQQFQQGSEQVGVIDSVVSSLTNLPETLLGQQEARPFDSILLLDSDYSQYYRVPEGSTYSSAWAFFVPRALWEGKPYGGGNAWFTENYAPRFYGEFRIETSISAVGEAWANFGFAGVAIVGLLLGLVAGWLHRLRSQLSLGMDFRMILYAFAAPVLISFVRGDAYHNVPMMLTVWVMWLAIRSLVVDSRSTGAWVTRDLSAQRWCSRSLGRPPLL